MQKFFSLAIAAVMVAAGLVAGSGGAATAAPYQTVPTDTAIDAPNRVERCDRARIGVRVTSSTPRNPRGKVLLVVKHDRRAFNYENVKDYDGRKIWFRTPKLCKRGSYTIRAKFSGNPRSRWADSKHFENFRVVRAG